MINFKIYKMMLKHKKRFSFSKEKGTLKPSKMLFPISPTSNMFCWQGCEETSSLMMEMQIGIIPMVVNLATFNKTAYSCTF